MKSRVRRLLSYCLLALIVLAAAEGIAQVGYRVAYGNWWSPDGLPRHATPAAAFEAREKRPGLISDYVLHPYTGFARQTGADPSRDELGFFTADKSDPRGYGSGDFVVVLTGGSVAIQAGLFGGLAERLTRQLGAAVLRGRRLRLVVVALGSFKQPQQLMALNYLLVLGIRIDAVVNLDGYNDLSSPTVENLRQGVHPIYPSGWAGFLRRRTGGAALATAGEIAYLRRREWALISPARRPVYHRSAFAGFLLTQRVQTIAARLATLRSGLRTGPARNAEAAGPAYRGDVERRRDDAADYWLRSSILMHGLARARGFSYLHVLQPNQYVADGKPLSAAETACCVDSRAGPNVRAGYRALLERKPALVAAGVDFVDGTRLFATERRTVYRDSCCHFNALGTDILAAFLATTLARRLGATTPPAPPKARQTP